jgi:hypothetical protein
MQIFHLSQLYVLNNQPLLISIKASSSNEVVEVVEEPDPAFNIPTDGSVDSQIAEALLVSNIDTAVKVWLKLSTVAKYLFQICMDNKRFSDALIIAKIGGPELLESTIQAYHKKVRKYIEKHAACSWIFQESIAYCWIITNYLCE